MITKCVKRGIILLVFAVISAILWGQFANRISFASADEDDVCAYSYCKIDITVDENKILRVEENLNVGFLRKRAHFTRAIRGKADSYYGVNSNTVLRGRSFLTKITDISAEVDGVPAQAELEGRNGLNHHISIDYPDGNFEPWTYENQLYYNIRLYYTYDLSDDADGKNMFFMNLFDHYYSRWFYFDGDEDNVATIEYNITFPAAPSEKTVLFNGDKKTDGVIIDGNTVSFAIPARGAEGYSLRVPFGKNVFNTSAEYYSYYWIFVGVLCAVMIFGVIIAYIFRARKPLAPVGFGPPIMNPLHFSAFWHGYARRKDACALIPQWAQLGCIRIKKDGKRDLILTKIKNLPEGRTTAEYAYFNALFADGDIYSSKQTRGRGNRLRRYKIRYAATQLADEAGAPVTYAKGVEKAKLVVMFSALLTLFVACSYFIFIADDYPYALLLFFLFGVMALMAFKLFPLLLAMRKTRQAHKELYRITSPLVTLGMFPLILIVWIIMFSHYMPVYDYIHITLISFCWILFCMYAMPNFIAKRTPEAQETYGKMVGFKKFLTAVKVSEMELMLEENPDYYLDVLPYCMIMGLSKKLDQKTEFISAPEWADGFDAATFASSMFGSMKRALITRKKKEKNYEQKR